MKIEKNCNNRQEWAENLYWLGLVSLDENQFEKAENAFSRALDLDPFHFESLYWRGIAHSKLGKHKPAAIDLYDCLSIEPSRAETYLQLATLQYANKQTDSAFQNFARFISVKL